MRVVGIHEAIESFREAALLPHRWTEALDVVARVFNSDGATSILRPTARRSVAVSKISRPLSKNTSTRSSIILASAGWTHCCMKPSCRIMPTFSLRVPLLILTIRNTSCHAGWRGTLAAALHGDLMISLKRNPRRGPYEGAELETLNRALPWLRAASSTACATWRAGFRGELMALRISGSGPVLHCSMHAVAFWRPTPLLAFGDGLDVKDGTLQASPPSAREASPPLPAGIARGQGGSQHAGTHDAGLAATLRRAPVVAARHHLRPGHAQPAQSCRHAAAHHRHRPIHPSRYAGLDEPVCTHTDRVAS